jgi:hypothetical protein
MLELSAMFLAVPSLAFGLSNQSSVDGNTGGNTAPRRQFQFGIAIRRYT